MDKKTVLQRLTQRRDAMPFSIEDIEVNVTEKCQSAFGRAMECGPLRIRTSAKCVEEPQHRLVGGRLSGLKGRLLEHK